MIAGHSNRLFLLLAGCVLFFGIHGYWHAHHYREGLPPFVDAFVLVISFGMVIGAFVAAGRLGGEYGHPHAARASAIAAVLVGYRAVGR